MGAHQKTLECIATVKKIHEQHPYLTGVAIANLLNNKISDKTVLAILNGKYDDYPIAYDEGRIMNTTDSRITSEMVIKIKNIKRKYPDMTATDIAEITAITSRSSVSKILNGEYDHLLTGEKKDNAQSNISYSNLTEEVRTFREQWLEDSENRYNELIDILIANNQLLTNIALILINYCEDKDHQPSKGAASHFRDMIKKHSRRSHEDIRS